MISSKSKNILKRCANLTMLLALVLLSPDLHSQTDADSTDIRDYRDSIIRIPNHRHGKMFMLDSTAATSISKRDFQFVNYTGLSDILSSKSDFYPLSLGSYGLFNHFMVDGGMPSAISFASNGRPMIDVGYGNYNPELIAPEFLESIEIFYGSKASIFGDNSPGVFVNIQEVRHNTQKPFTKIWVAQGGAEFLAADGIISQNFHPEWNFTFGFRNINADGRFSNNWVNSWNTRILLRWSPDDSTSITFTESFSNHGHGNSGGINTHFEQDLYDELSSRPLFDGLNERVFRHDLNLSFSKIFPTNSAITLTAYFSHADYERSSGRNFSFGAADTSRQIYKNGFHYYGISGRYEQKLFGFMNFKTGGYFDRRQADETYIHNEVKGVSFAGFGHLAFNLSDYLVLSGGTRLFTLYENVGVAIGANLMMKVSDRTTIEFDLSRANRLPHPAEGLNLLSEEHYTAFALFNHKFGESTNFRLKAFGKRINDFIATQVAITGRDTLSALNINNAGNVELLGLQSTLDFKIGEAFTVLMRLWSYPMASGDYKDKFPLLFGGLRVFYTYSPGKSILRVGLDLKASSGGTSYAYMPLSRTYYNSDFESDFTPHGLDAFIEIKIGTAYFKGSFMNLLSTNYHQVALYPDLTRNFRMSVNWAFLE